MTRHLDKFVSSLEARDALSRLAKDPDAKIRAGAMDAVGGALDPKRQEALAEWAEGILAAGVNDSEKSVQLEAGLPLLVGGRDSMRIKVPVKLVGETLATFALEQFGGEGDNLASALRAAARLGPRARDFVPHIFALLEDFRYRRDAAIALGRIGPDALDAGVNHEALRHS